MRRRSPVRQLPVPPHRVAEGPAVREAAASPGRASPRRVSPQSVRPQPARLRPARRVVMHPLSGKRLKTSPPPASPAGEHLLFGNLQRIRPAAADRRRGNPRMISPATADQPQGSLPKASLAAAGSAAADRFCADRSASYASGREPTGSPGKAREVPLHPVSLVFFVIAAVFSASVDLVEGIDRSQRPQRYR